MNNKKQFIVILLSVLFCFIGCVSLKECPYKVLLEEKCLDFVCSDSDLNICFSVTNTSLKKICSFSVILSLFNSDGEPVFYSDSISIDFDTVIPIGKEEYFEISCNDYIDLDEDDILIIDYFYLTNVIFEDGSVWSDEFGLFSES